MEGPSDRPHTHRSRLGLRPDRLAWRGVELLVAASFAIAQPLFSLVGENPTFLVADGVQGGAFVGYALLVVLVPPAVLFLVGVLCCSEHCSRSPWARRLNASAA